jgi:hypothetical protein
VARIDAKSLYARKLLDNLIFLLGMSIYMVGMMRQDGIDYAGYLFAYYEDPLFIPDKGYQILMQLLRLSQLPFEMIMAAISIITIFSLRRASRHFGVNFSLLIIIYLLHFAVIRDFAQLRSGLAISLALIALTSSRTSVKWSLYLFAASIHMTSIVFILSFEICKWISEREKTRNQWVGYLVLIVTTIVIAKLLNFFVFIDPRVSLYLTWQEDDYGLPVKQYAIIYFYLFICLLAFWTRNRWKDKLEIRMLVMLQILAVIAFFSLSEFAIFAYRISSAIGTLYPFLLLYTLKEFRLRINGYNVSMLATGFIFFSVCVMFLTRPGSFEILKQISFY